MDREKERETDGESARAHAQKLQVIFRKRATNYRALLRKMTYEDKAPYDPTPPCSADYSAHASERERRRESKRENEREKEKVREKYRNRETERAHAQEREWERERACARSRAHERERKGERNYQQYGRVH